MGNIMYFI